MSDIIVYRCRSRDHCVDHSSDGAALTSTGNTICAPCIRRIGEQLRQLPHLMEALESFKRIPITGGGGGSKVNATPTPSVPINLSVVDLITDIWRVLNRAGGPEIEVRNLINEQAEYFMVWRSGKRQLRLVDGVERALDIGAVWRKADGIVGLSEQWVHRHAPCLRCGQRSLGMFVGRDTVHCTNPDCRKQYQLTEYERLCIARAEIDKLSAKKAKKK